jgi:hypothetical protein
MSALGIFLSTFSPLSLAQKDETDSLFQAVPFEEWMKDGPKAQLPWRTRISSPELSLHQRIQVRFQVELDGNEILRRCCGARAIALLEIADPRGQIFRNYAAQEIKRAQPGLSQSFVVLSWDVFLLPGDYGAAMALYYRGREGHSLTLEKLHVNAIRNDPLPEAWRDLPTVEFCDPQPEGVDEFLFPRVEGHLNLPINNRRPIQLDILENLTPYTAEQRTPWLYKERLRAFLPILKSLGQLQLLRGSLNLATMDFTRSRVTFEQKEILNGHLDLTGLKDSLAANAITVVDVHDIRNSERYGQFFAQEIGQRLNAENQPNTSQESSPLHALIIVSGGMELGAGGQSPLKSPDKGDFVVFYLRWDPVFRYPPAIAGMSFPRGGIDSLRREQFDDGIGKALKTLKPRIFSVNSPESLRRAMASIIVGLSQR